MKIGVDLGGTNIRVGRIQEGKVATKISEPCLAQAPEKEIVGQLKRMIAAMIVPGVESIGIGVPSVVDVDRGIVYNVANIPSWREVHLKAILENEFHLPVAVNNDCNCFALGEYYFGVLQRYANMVCLALGTGVGAGIIIAGKLYPGYNAGAGEVGSLPYLERDYEYYCSSRFFLPYGLTGREAYEQNASTAPLPLWNDLGRHIGALIQAVLYTYDPEAIILGGSISKAFALFEPSMRVSLATFPYPETLRRLRIAPSLSDDIPLLGASTLC